ncbi:MAG: hypothetical protein ACJ736_39625 [Streptomyces sp.]
MSPLTPGDLHGVQEIPSAGVISTDRGWSPPARVTHPAGAPLVL